MTYFSLSEISPSIISIVAHKKLSLFMLFFFPIVEAFNALTPYTRNMRSLFNQGGAKHSHFLSTSTNIHKVDLKDC